MFPFAPPIDPVALRQRELSKSVFFKNFDSDASLTGATNEVIIKYLQSTSHNTNRVNTLLQTYPGFLDELPSEYQYLKEIKGHGKEHSVEGSTTTTVKRRRIEVTDEAMIEEDPSANQPIAQISSFEPSATIGERDYQGRSYLFPPTVRNDATLKKPCRIPKRLAFVCGNVPQPGDASQSNTGVCALKWAGGDPDGMKSGAAFGNVLFAGDVSGTVKAWNVGSAASCKVPLATFRSHMLPISGMDTAHGGKLLSTSSRDGCINIWDAEAGKLVAACRYEGKDVGCTSHLLHPENSNLVLGAFDKEIALFDTRTNTGLLSSPVVRLYHGHMSSVLSLAWVDNSRGLYFLSTSSDKTLRTWDFNVPTQIKQFGDSTMHAMSSVVKHPHQESFAAQAFDDSVRVFSHKGGGRLIHQRDMNRFTGHKVSGTACKLAFSHDGQFLSSGDSLGQLYVWSWKTGELLKSFSAHSKMCATHLWHPTEPSKIVTGGWDSTIKIWL